MSMDPTKEAPGNGAAGMKWPLIGSAAGHLALLVFLLLLRAAAGPSFPGAVQVVLVAGARANGPAEERLGGGVSEDRRRLTGSGAGPEPVSHVVPDPGDPLPSPSFAAETGIFTGAGGKASGEPVSDGGSPPGGTPSGAGGRKEASAAFGPAGGAKRASVAAPGVAGGSGGGDGPEIRLLRDRIESRIVYPEEAIRRGQEGEVLLRIRVGEGGIPGEIRIARSSGARALDEAARNGVVRAAPLPSLPGWFEVPVRFFLR